jgi:purine-binding chemotaxis protein CheW
LRDELVGLLVDEVRHVIRLKDEDIEPPPGVFDRVEAEHIVGVGRQEGEMYTLLDLDSVIQIDRYLKIK